MDSDYPTNPNLSLIRPLGHPSTSPPPTVSRESLFRLPDPSLSAEFLDLRPAEDAGDNGPARIKSRTESIRQALAEHRLTLEDTFQHRMVVAWRITRLMAMSRGLIGSPEMSLIEAMPDPYAWRYPPFPSLDAEPPRFTGHPLSDQMTAVVFKARTIPHDYAPRNRPEPRYEGEPPCILGITPPEVPEAFCDPSGRPFDDYDPTDPAHDPLLHAWLRAVDICVKAGNILAGSQANPMLGRHGLMGLTDPWLTRVAWPSPGQIMAFESSVVEEVLGLIVDHNPTAAARRIRHSFGVSPEEARAVIAQAVYLAGRSTVGGIEESRAIMIMRLEKFIETAKQELNLREQMQALKQLAIVQGLSKESPDEFSDSFRKLVQSTAQERKQPPRLLTQDGD